MREVCAKLNAICEWLDDNGFFKEAEELECVMERVAADKNQDFLKQLTQQQFPSLSNLQQPVSSLLNPQQNTKQQNKQQDNYLNNVLNPLNQDPNKLNKMLNPNWEKEQHNKKAVPQQAQKYTNHFVDASRATGISVPLLLSLAKRESTFNPQATSSVGAYGLMQVYPAVGDARTPKGNILAGAQKLKSYLDMFGDIKPALAAYNWGPTNMRKVNGDWTKAPKSVQQFVSDVLSGMQTFQA